MAITIPPGVRLTDGVWDRDQRPLYFFAGGQHYGQIQDEIPEFKFQPCLVAVNDFAEPGRPISQRQIEAWLLPLLDAGIPVFLDSGVFWLTNRHKRAHDMTMDAALSLHPDEVDDFDWLFDTYVEMCLTYRDRLWGYNELDQGGKTRKVETRGRLEALGLNPIPVYHPLNDGWDYFDDLASSYDRMCWGNVVQAHNSARVRMVRTLAERHRKYPYLWVHLLGLTPNELVAGEPFDSADSSSWLSVWRYTHASKERSLGKNVTTMGKPWWYLRTRAESLDEEDADPNGERAHATHEKAAAMSNTTFSVNLMNMQHWRHRLIEEIGQPFDYPPLLDEETEPCPGP